MRRGCTRCQLDGTDVGVSEDFGPAVVGVLRPTIIVPRWMVSLAPCQRALILRHELEHRRAHDAALLSLAAVAVMAAPWNLAVVWQTRRLRRAVELDCDRRVLRSGTDPLAYGQLLLAIATRTLPTRPPVPALLERGRTNLERRLERITEVSAGRSVRSASVAAASTLVIHVLACRAPAPPVGAPRARLSRAGAPGRTDPVRFRHGRAIAGEPDAGRRHVDVAVHSARTRVSRRSGRAAVRGRTPLR
jgi:hypothetical protein